MTILGHLDQHPGINPPGFTATVTAVSEQTLEVDKTFYYPMGGGQPADRGVISADTFRCDVIGVSKKESVIHHIDSIEGKIQAGDIVQCSIDQMWRNQLSQMHTAQHLISALAHEEWGANTVGNQIGNERTRIDLQFENRDVFDRDHLQQMVNEAIEKDLTQNQSDLISHSISAATFAPELDEGHYTQFVMNKRLAANRSDFHKVHYYSYQNDADEVASVPPVADKSKEGTEEEPQTGEDLWRISARIRPGEKDYDQVILQIEKHVDGYLAKRSAESQEKQKKAEQHFEKIKQLVKQKIAEESEVCKGADNEQECLDKVKQKYDVVLTNQKKKFDNIMRAVANDALGVNVEYTGMVPLFHIAQRELLNGLFKSFVLAFLLIAVMMVIWFRNFASGLVSMLPNVFPAAVIFGWMGWTDRIVDIGSMMTASVAMGIAVDDTVHFLTWFRRGIASQMSRTEAVLYSYRRCALAMTQTTLIAGLGLVVFSLSSFQPVSQFGLLMFLLLLAALVGDLLFLPSLLASPAGKLFQAKKTG